MHRYLKHIIVLAFCVMVAFPASSLSETKFSMGIKGGLNLTMPGGDELSGRLDDFAWALEDYDTLAEDAVSLNAIEITKLSSMTAFLVGGFVNIQFNEKFSLQPELLYIRKGGQQDLEVNTTLLGFVPADLSGTIKWKLDYVEIPVLLKVMIPTEGSIKPSFYAGPALSFAVSSNLGLEIMGVSEDFDISSFVSSIDFGLVFGGGLDIDLSPSNFIVIDARYELGLSDWTDEPLLDLVTVKNGGIQFMAGIGFRLGG
jgi:hypothetical protein